MIEIGIEVGIDLPIVEKIAARRDPRIVIEENRKIPKDPRIAIEEDRKIPRDPRIAIRAEDRKIPTGKSGHIRLGFLIAKGMPNDRDHPRDRKTHQTPLKYPNDRIRTIEQQRRQVLLPQLLRQLQQPVYRNTLFISLK